MLPPPAEKLQNFFGVFLQFHIGVDIAMNKGNLISKPAAKELDALSELHKTLGDYTRIRILWLLMEREWCVSELAGEMKMTESAISHQLRILRSARLVNGRKAGKNVFYTLADEHIRWILEKTYDHISEQ